MFKIKNWEELDNTGSCYCLGINSCEWYYPTTRKADGKVYRIDIRKKGQKLCSMIYVLNQTTKEIIKTLASYGIFVEFIEQPKLSKREWEWLKTFSDNRDKQIFRIVEGNLFFQTCLLVNAIDITLFPFIEKGEVWTFEKLLELEVKG